VIVATIAYASFLLLAALLLPDPRFGAQGFHVSFFGALAAGLVMALILAGIRTWIVSKISAIGFSWPTLAGGLLAVLVVLVVANGLLRRDTLAITGLLGWIVTPVIVWIGTIAFERIDATLVKMTQASAAKVQSQVNTVAKHFVQTKES
jgi:MFS family permease